jgi:hypothetical protein
MTWRSKSKLRANAIKHGYRSGFEHKVSDQLSEAKIKYGYEDTVIPYIRPETKHTYTIDFTLPNGILVETKGRWVLEDRKKHLLIKEQHPELDIRIVLINMGSHGQKNIFQKVGYKLELTTYFYYIQFINKIFMKVYLD